VIYNVSPVSSAGCVGAPFTVTVTVESEPVTTGNVTVIGGVCSDIATGYNLTVSGAATYNISTNSNGLVTECRYSECGDRQARRRVG